MHPLVVVVYYAALAVLCMLLFHPVFLTISLLLLLGQAMLHGAGGTLRAWALPYALTGAGIVLWNPLFSHRGDHVLFYIGYTPIVLEAVIYGLTMMLLVLSVLVLFVNYAALIGSLQFLFLFGKILPNAAVTVALALRFIPLLRRRLSDIAAVQRTRGLAVTQGSLRLRLASGMRLLQAALVWSLEEALQTAESLAAKGYGTAKRSSHAYYRVDRRDVLLLACALAVFAACLLLWLRGYGVMAIYPVLAGRWMSGAAEWLQLALFTLYAALPILVEWRERLAWRALK